MDNKLKIKRQNLMLMEYLEKLKIEARSRTMIGLPNHCSLSFGKVLTKRSESKARSWSKSSLLEFASLSSHEVPAEFAK